MEVILLQNVEDLGEKGSLANVARGYARNFLIPRKLAEPATPGKIAEFRRREEERKSRDARMSVQAEEYTATLNKTELTLTAKAGEYDQLEGFALGADDYVTKPFSPGLLVARVEALLRRSGPSTETPTEFDGIRIDEPGHTVYLDGKRLELTPKEYDLLLYLYENGGIALSRERLLSAVWNYDFYGDLRTVDTHVKQLRAKLGTRGDRIRTIRGIGYSLEVEA